VLCPYCQSEFKEGVTYCKRCDSTLIDEDEDDSVEEDEFVPLLEVTSSDLFSRVTHELEEAKIPWFVQSDPSQSSATVATIHVASRRFDEAKRRTSAFVPV
jgi:hypothetical protein